MCFSSTASFTASSVLTVIGVMTLRETTAPSPRLLASVPLLFALQQFTEGLLWLVLLQGKSGAEQYWLTQIYAFFVGAVWPLIIPFGIFLVEPHIFRRRCLALLLLVSGGLALFTLIVIARFGVHAEIFKSCILYTHPAEQGIHMLALYIITTCVPFFLSSSHSIRRIGVVNIGTFIAAYYFYWDNLASVWCFFAAIISSCLYLHFKLSGRVERNHHACASWVRKET